MSYIPALQINQQEKQNLVILFLVSCIAFLALTGRSFFSQLGIAGMQVCFQLVLLIVIAFIFLYFFSGKWEILLGLSIVQFTTFYREYAGSPFLFNKVMVSDLVFIFLLLFWIFNRILTGNTRSFGISSLTISIFIFLAVGVLSLVIGYMNGNHRGYVRLEASDILYFTFYFIFLDTIIQIKQVNVIFWIFMVAINIFSLEIAILEYYWASAAGHFVRIYNHTFVYMQIVLVIGASLLLSGSVRKHAKLLTITMIGPSIALLISLTRGYWMGFIAGLAIILLIYYKKVSFKFIFITALILLIIFGGITFLTGSQYNIVTSLIGSRFASISQFQKDVSPLARIIEMAQVWKEWSQHPLFGKGLGGAILMPSSIKHGKLDWWWHIHNGYFSILHKQGLLGLIAYFATAFTFFWRGMVALRKTTVNYLKALIIGFISSYAGLMVTAFSSPHSVRIDTAIFISFMMAVVELVASGRLKDENTILQR